jgi:endoglucanase
MPAATQNFLPRWRGFNLLGVFHTRSEGRFDEDDFRWLAEWGFDFARLPMCYLLWTEPGDPFRVREPVLVEIDRAVRLGERYGVHVCLNLHRAPGYSVNRERAEPFDLWHDERALEAFCFHWQLFAERYRAIPSQRLSFNLVNEPPAPVEGSMTRADHERVVRAAVQAIRRIDPERLIVADGLAYGNEPSPELADLGIAQSCRAYLPMGLTHYRADWVRSQGWPRPVWPGALHYGQTWDRARLEQHYARWADLARQGVGVHCGEGGAFNRTPHPVFLAWLRDVLEILTAHGIGYALWNLRGAFGVLDSGREDVAYEEWHGHQLDRGLLELLQEF